MDLRSPLKQLLPVKYFLCLCQTHKPRNNQFTSSVYVKKLSMQLHTRCLSWIVLLLVVEIRWFDDNFKSHSQNAEPQITSSQCVNGRQTVLSKSFRPLRTWYQYSYFYYSLHQMFSWAVGSCLGRAADWSVLMLKLSSVRDPYLLHIVRLGRTPWLGPSARSRSLGPTGGLHCTPRRLCSPAGPDRNTSKKKQKKKTRWLETSSRQNHRVYVLCQGSYLCECVADSLLGEEEELGHVGLSLHHSLVLPHRFVVPKEKDAGRCFNGLLRPQLSRRSFSRCSLVKCDETSIHIWMELAVGTSRK